MYRYFNVFIYRGSGWYRHRRLCCSGWHRILYIYDCEVEHEDCCSTNKSSTRRASTGNPSMRQASGGDSLSGAVNRKYQNTLIKAFFSDITLNIFFSHTLICIIIFYYFVYEVFIIPCFYLHFAVAEKIETF